jgi:xanthine/CO dehydrogenase XdhC/CoxF family maturation factor
MFEIASEVLRWHRSNETGVVARVVSVNGLATRWPAQAIAATGRHATVGTILASVADPQLLPVISNALGQSRDGSKGNGRVPWATAKVVSWFLASGHDSHVGGGTARHTESMVRLFGRGRSTTAVGSLVNGSEVLVDALWPVPRLLVVGDGVVADAVVVLSHDLELASPTLKAALGGGAGYVGALGARRTQAAARSGCRTTASCLPRSPAFAVLLGLT